MAGGLAMTNDELRRLRATSLVMQGTLQHGVALGPNARVQEWQLAHALQAREKPCECRECLLFAASSALKHLAGKLDYELDTRLKAKL